MHSEKVAALTRPTVTCPKCGAEAAEVKTQYGIRSSCCGLWSYDRRPLVDKNTHEARKAVYSLIKKMGEQVGSVEMQREVRKRCGVPELKVADMNEATCKKVIAAMEDMLVDIIAGDLKLSPKQGKKR